MIRWIKWGLLALVAIFAIGQPGLTSYAQTQNNVVLLANAGFEGYFNSGAWLPISVVIENNGPDLDVVVEAFVPSSFSSTQIYGTQVDLPNQSRKALTIMLPLDGFTSQVQVQVRDGTRILANQQIPLSQMNNSDYLYGVWVANSTPFNVLRNLDPIGGDARVAQIDGPELPTEYAAWASLDVLVISNTDTGLLSDAQRQALQAWLNNGGRLIVATGLDWQKTTAGLADILPATVSGTSSVDTLTSMATFANAATAPEGSLPIANLTPNPNASTMLSAGTRPLIVAQQVGYGWVFMLAFDPALEPMSSYVGLEGVFRALLSLPVARPSWATQPRNWYNGGQAISSIPGLGLPPVWQICGFMTLYIVLVGPLNYLVLRRLKRRELAWITVPVLVILFTVFTYVVGFGARGSRPVVHQVQFVEVWENQDTAIVHGLAGVYSPRRTRYNLTLSEGVLRPFPEDLYFGGLSSIGGSLILQNSPTQVHDVAIDIAEVKVMTYTAQTAAPQITSNLTLTAGPNPEMTGTITNGSNLLLEDAVLLTTGTYQPLGDIAPGATINVRINVAQSRAAPAGTSGGGVPASPGLPVPGPITPPPYSSSYDTTADEIMGFGSYYDDVKKFRRYSLITWFLEPYNNGNRGGGTFLAAWHNGNPVVLSVDSIAYNSESETLYMVALTPTYTETDTNQLVVPPGLMTWELLDPGTVGGGSPYDGYIYNGYYALRFRPQAIVGQFSEVTSLTMHLYSYGAGSNANVSISLFDYSLQNWIELQNPIWGDNLISSPERFVGPDGTIDARIANAGSFGSISLERFDFTLAVER